MSKVKEYYKIEGKHGDPWDYVHQYERLARECKKPGGGTLTGEMKGCHLLGQFVSQKFRCMWF